MKSFNPLYATCTAMLFGMVGGIVFIALAMGAIKLFGLFDASNEQSTTLLLGYILASLIGGAICAKLSGTWGYKRYINQFKS